MARSPIFLSLFTAGFLGLLPQIAYADVFTELATWNVANEGGTGTFSGVRQINITGGASYSNTRDAVFNNSTNHAIFGVPVASLSPGAIFPGNYSIVGAIKGTQTGNPNNASVSFDSALFAIVPRTGAFDENDAGTWGNLAAPLAIYGLKPSGELISQGAGQPIITHPVGNGVQTSNIAQPGSIGGEALFRELVNGFINNDTMTPSPPFTAADFVDEGMFVDFDDQIVNAVGDFAATPAAIATFNTLFAFFFPGENFATIGTGTATDFDPIFNNGASGTPGDFAATLQAQLFPISQFEEQEERPPLVPEPASVLIWSLMGLVLGGGTVVRRRFRQPTV